MPGGQMPQKGRVHLFWVMALMLACHEGDAPTEPRDGPPVSYSIMDPFTGSLPVGTANYPDGTLTLPTYTGVTLVKISISGTTTVTPPNNYPSYPVDARGVSWSNHCTAGAWIDYYPYAWTPQCPLFDNLSPSSPVEAYTYVSGSGTARRYGGVAGSPPPYSYSGAFSVTIAPVRAKLSLKASRYVVLAPNNTSVTFTAQISPTTVGNGITIPWSRSWRWVPDAGGTPQTCGSGETCTMSITASGTMFVDGIVNTETQTASVHIRVTNCLTGDPQTDSLLVKYPMLDAMKNAWDEGDASNADKTQREERPWSVNCDANGVCTPITYNPVASTPCGTEIPVDTTGTRKVSGHIHPFIPYGFPGAEQIPTTVCPPYVETYPGGGQTTQYGFPILAGAGPSPDDYKQAAGEPTIPHFVMDSKTLYFMPPNSVPFNILAGTLSFPRLNNGCQLL